MTDNGMVDQGPIADVGSQRVARVYAEALLNAAEKRGLAQETGDDLQELVASVFARDGQFEAFLTSTAIGRDRKEQAIRQAFQGRASDTFVDFLLVLNEHDRLDLLRAMRMAYAELLDERMKRMRVLVRSAVAVPDDQLQRLKDELRQTFQKEPIVQTRLDPGLLGGVVVKVGDWLYDASVRTQLDNLRNQLIERSSYEIQSRRDRFRSAE